MTGPPMIPWLIAAYLTTLVVFDTRSCSLVTCTAFVPIPTPVRAHRKQHLQTKQYGGLFGGDSDILKGIFGGNANNGPKLVIDLAAKDVKIGALRFLLQIYLVGEQNKPAPKSWLTKQGDGIGDLQVYYSDGTGMLSIELKEYSVKMVRYGESPSLQYQLQESVLVHGVLDELYNVAFAVEEDNIEQEKRLLQLEDEDIINKARDSLPARAES